MRTRACACWLAVLPPLLLALLAAVALIHEHYCSDFSALSHYEVLGMTPSAQPRAVKRAFRELSLRFHPDKSGGSLDSNALTVRRFHRISDAYQVLSDPRTRAAYDQEIHARELHSPQLRFTPPTREWRSVIRFYAVDFPHKAAQLALRHIDGQHILLLIPSAVAVILLSGVVRVLWSVLTRSPAAVSVRKRANDEAMHAARVRQQQLLDSYRGRVMSSKR